MWFHRIKLRNKIFLLCTFLVFFTTVVIQASTWLSSHKFNQQQLTERVLSAKQVLIEYLSAQEKLLVIAANVLTSDFGFIRAVATSDAETIKSVLQNHGKRIDADLMLLTDLSGSLISSSRAILSDSDLNEALIKSLINSPGKSFFATINQHFYQLILLPVKAPHTIAYSVVGFEITAEDMDALKKLTGVDVSFYDEDKQLLISTIGIESFRQFQDNLNNQLTYQFMIPRPAYITEELLLPSTSLAPVGVLLTSSLAPLYAQYDEIIIHNFLLALLVAIIASLLSIFLAKSLTIPLTKLTKLAEKFAAGDYSSTIDLERSGIEARQLLSTFEMMGQRIKLREDKILYQAQYDILTGLYNIYTAKQKLPEYLASGRQKLLVAFSIRNFRQINDRLGPDIADDCLKALSARLKHTELIEIQMAARLDGVEFFSLLNLSEKLSHIHQVDNFLSSLEGDFNVAELMINLELNAGVVIYPDNGTDTTSLLRRTSIALDNARKSKQRIHFYKDGEDEAHLERLAITDALKNLFKKPDTEELFMVYQPKINLQDQSIKAEALIRWKHPDKGFISPELFVNLAEQAGLIIELTDWVIDSVFSQMAFWQNKGLIVPVSINVSAQDLMHKDFEKHLCELVERHQINQALVTLEITERDIMHHEHIVVAALKRLKSHGFHIAIDDYGIGQSSLSKLKDLPVDEIKLDKSFIMQLASSEKDKLIVRSTIQLAHQLGFYVVAEGVENEAGLQILSDFGCDEIQGYFISKPLSASTFYSWQEEYVEKNIS